MQEKRYTRRPLLMLLLALTHSLAFSQNSLAPHKITIFKDGGQITQKGILRFYEQKARLDAGFNYLPQTIEVSKSTDFGIVYVKFLQDSSSSATPVSNWREVLEANQGREIDVTFSMGNEVDEISGELISLDEETGLFVLKNESGKLFFLTIDQVRLVIGDANSNWKLAGKASKPVIEVKIDAPIPFAPLELSGLVEGFSWVSSCKVVTVSEEEAHYEFGAIITNNAVDFTDIQAELKGAHVFNQVPDSEQNRDVFDLGTISLRRNETILVKLSDSRHQIERVHLVEVPWEGVGKPTRTGPFKAVEAVGFKKSFFPAASCEMISLYDENYNLLAKVSSQEYNKKIDAIKMGTVADVKVYYEEKEKKKGSRQIKIGDITYDKYLTEGKLVVINGNPDATRIKLARELFGEVTKAGGGAETPGEDNHYKWLNWEFKLRAGDSREIPYEYEAYVPASD